MKNRCITVKRVIGENCTINREHVGSIFKVTLQLSNMNQVFCLCRGCLNELKDEINKAQNS